MPVPSDTESITGWRTKELNGSDLVTLLMGIGVLGLAVYLAVGLLGVASPGVRATLLRGASRVPFEVRWDASSHRAPAQTASVGRLVGFDTVVLDSAAVPEVTDAVPMVVLGGIGLCFLYHLRRLLWTIETGQPFDGANGRRLRLMAGGTIATGFARDAWQFVGLDSRLHEVGNAVRAVLPGVGVRYDIHYSWSWYLGAVVIFALAHAFEMGTRLQRDHDLTV